MPLLVPLHGIASRHDLPLPFGYVVAGAAAAMLVSFAVLILAWRRPRLATDRAAPLPLLSSLWSIPAVRWALRGLVLAGYAVAAAAMFAGQDLLINPVFGFVYVWIWVGLVPVSLILGQAWRALNPVRTVHRGLTALVRTDPDVGLAPLPPWVGVYPAALALLGFAWLELIQSDRATLPVLRVWALVWFFGALVGAIVFGRRWIAAAEPFEAYATTVSRVSWLTSAPRPAGRAARDMPPGPGNAPGETAADRPADMTRLLRAGNPLQHLMSWPAPPGTAAVVCVLLGSTAFDSFQNTSWWLGASQSVTHPTVFATLGLLAMVAIVWVTFSLACWAMRPFVRPDARAGLPGRMASSVVPIVVGYAFAHYFSFMVVEGQRTAITMSDPLGRGWNLFGTAELGVNAHLYDHPVVIAWLQLCFILAGHIVGVVAAHEKSLTLLRERSVLVGQIPMLALMVCYTCAGLLLLFSP